MAARNKTANSAKHRGGRAGRGKAPAASPKNPAAGERAGGLKAEIVAIITLAAAFLLLFSLFSGGAGVVGAFVNDLLKRLFGIGAYILPLAAITVCALVIFADGVKILRPQVIMLTGLFFVVICLFHVFANDTPGPLSALEYIKYHYVAGSEANGGLFGALLGDGLAAALGRTGAYIALITAGTVLLILITGRSLFAVLRMARDQAGGAIKRGKTTIIQKRARNAKPIKVKSMTDKNLEVCDAPSLRPARELFNYEVKDDDDNIPRLSEEERLDLINERLKAGITRPKRPETPGPEAAGPGEGPETTPPFEPDGLEAGPGGPENDFAIKVTGIGIEGLEEEAEFKKPAAAQLGLDHILDMAMRSEFGEYKYPPMELLFENDYAPTMSTMVQIKENSKKLEDTLKSFGVEAKVIEVSKGPTVTRYELSPGQGVKVNKISGLADDLALNLAAMGIRIEAPIPGKSAVGIELPNKEVQPVFLRDVIDDPEFMNSESRLTFAVGKDIAGNTVVADIAKMPHLLIAGSTGSGKSVCINTLIASILFKSRPDEVKLLMVDPKVVELSVYNGIPHLLIPVVTDPEKAAGALNWAVVEMEKRYGQLASVNVRDLKSYNKVKRERGEESEVLPQIVIIIDELADLMLSSGKKVEESICRIAQKARAAGIHLIIATQRPSVNVITGTIKANVASRLAFAVSSGIDSRTILDANGAERLLGKGDMLFSPMGLSKPKRIQGAFISDTEVERIVGFLKTNSGECEYDPDLIDEITAPAAPADKEDGSDEMSSQLMDAAELVIEKGKASTSMLQRYFRIGYNTAARMIEELEQRGIIGPEDGAKPRKVLMSAEEWERYRVNS